MSEDLLNFDELPSTTAAPIKSAVPTTGSLIDLSEPSDVAAGPTTIGASSGNLLDLDEQPKANPFGDGVVEEQQSTVQKIDIVVDPFGASSEVSPSKNPQLPPPLIPSPANPVAPSLSAEIPSFLPLPAPPTLLSVLEQDPQQSQQQHVSLSSPLSAASPLSERSTTKATPGKTVMTPSIGGLTSRLNPVPPAILPAHLPLPTRKWTDPTSFCQVPVTDSIGEAVSKSFSHLPVNQRPQRNTITVAQALESTSSDAFLPLIASNR